MIPLDVRAVWNLSPIGADSRAMRRLVITVVLVSGCANMTDEQRAKAQKAAAVMGAMGRSFSGSTQPPPPKAVRCTTQYIGNMVFTNCYEVAQ